MIWSCEPTWILEVKGCHILWHFISRSYWWTQISSPIINFQKISKHWDRLANGSTGFWRWSMIGILSTSDLLSLKSRRQLMCMHSVSWHRYLPHPVSVADICAKAFSGKNQYWNFVNTLNTWQRINVISRNLTQCERRSNLKWLVYSILCPNWF